MTWSSFLRTSTAVLALVELAACGDSLSTDRVSGIAAQAPAPYEAESAAVVTFSCDVNAGGPAYSYLTATGQLSATGAPINVSVFPTYSPGNVGSFRTAAKLLPTYGMTPWFPRSQAWNVTGHANGVGNPGDLYVLQLPAVLPGAGGVVPGQVDVYFAEGQNGNWQATGLCLIG